MKAHHWLILGALGVGGYFAWKYRANIKATISPDPTVSTIAGSTYGPTPNLPGTILSALQGIGGAGSSSSSGYDPTSAMPSDNTALTGSLGDGSYAGGSYA